MGVNLGDIIESRPIELEELRGRTIAIDSYNAIYQFLSSIRDRFTGEPLKDSKGRVTSHLSGLLYRTAKLMENGISPVFVFDGKPPELKRAVQAQRREVRERAEEKWRTAVKEGDVESVRRYSQQASRLTGEMIEESKQLLTSMGVPCVQAPSEGEAEAALLASQGKVWAIGSQDWDSLMFGSPRLVKNLAITGKRKVPGRERYVTIKPKMVELQDALRQLDITREQLVILGILVGTDYADGGVKGIGPKKALSLVKRHKSIEDVMGEVKWEHDADPVEIYKIFMEPPQEDMEIPEATLDKEKIRRIMVDEHSFSGERVDGVLEKLGSSPRGQSSLGSFFGH